MPLTLAQALKEIEELKATVDRLTAELNFQSPDPDIERVTRTYRLTRNQAILLLRLAEAHPKGVKGSALLKAIPPSPHRSAKAGSSQLVKVMTHHIREALGYDVIDTSWGQGYRLGDGWKERIKGEPHAETDQSPTPTAHAGSSR